MPIQPCALLLNRLSRICTPVGSGAHNKGLASRPFHPNDRAALTSSPRAGTLLSMRRMKKIFDDIFSRFDVVLCPTLGQPPAELGWLAPDLEFDVAWHRLRHYAGFTPLANTLGNCAISLPLHRNADGLPIGVQFAGPSGHEKTLLELAFALEQAAPWPRSTGVRTP